ncbi:carbohydrate ABC transporter substrate-binding protein [Streptomyces sp. KM273126]|uniref:ABC transporter substrate-binding protein n=1 Tax=Streptomyces sp. KM273126 TaxID=2545247 RepID=UPI001404CFAB|nr:ABC transporter substrate-binding protein [Streptomyces sp. KM273126]MBA2813263.1 carbohydrate ABC transporter substrate-binding protein [Streptomyces sp. KM273126]
MRRPPVPFSPSRRRVLASLGGLGLGAAVAGCGTEDASADGTVELNFQWWGGDERNVATQKAVRLFQRRHPKIKLSVSFTGYDSYFQRLATQVAAGTGPDVLQMDYYQLRSYAANGLIANLSGPEFSGIDLDAVPRAYVDADRLDGKLWAVPTGISTQALLVDPTIWRKAGGFPKPGWTWDDLSDDVGPALRKAAPDRSPLTDFGRYSETFDLWLVQRGKSLYKDDGSLGFTEADLTAFWELTARLRDKGVFTPPHLTASYDGSTASSLLVRKLSTAEFNLTGTVMPYFEAYGDIALVPFPTASASAPLGLTAGPGMMCVRQSSAHKRQAAQLIDFLLNDPAAGNALGVVRGLPPNRKIMNRIAPGLSKGDRMVYAYVSSLEKMFSASTLPPSGSDEDKLEFRRVNEDVLFGKKTVREAAAEMFEKYNSTVPKG